MLIPVRIAYLSSVIMPGSGRENMLISEAAILPLTSLSADELEAAVTFVTESGLPLSRVDWHEESGEFYKSFPAIRVAAEDYPLTKFLMLNQHGATHRQLTLRGRLVSPNHVEGFDVREISLSDLAAAGGVIDDADTPLRRQQALNDARSLLGKLGAVDSLMVTKGYEPRVQVSNVNYDPEIKAVSYCAVDNGRPAHKHTHVDFPYTHLAEARDYAHHNGTVMADVAGELIVSRPDLATITPPPPGARP